MNRTCTIEFYADGLFTSTMMAITIWQQDIDLLTFPALIKKSCVWRHLIRDAGKEDYNGF